MDTLTQQYLRGKKRNMNLRPGHSLTPFKITVGNVFLAYHLERLTMESWVVCLYSLDSSASLVLGERDDALGS